MMAMSFGFAHAQSKEAPPREPPYTDDNEFDPLQGEDPASSSPIPVSPTDDPVAGKPAAKVPVTSSTPTPAPPTTRSTYSAGARDKPFTPSEKEKGLRLLHHPDAQKGLMRIEADGTYIYKVKLKKGNETGTFRIGIMEPPKISSADGVHHFADMYGSSGMMTIMGEYEMHPFTSFRQFGLQAGLGFATASGHGFFLTDAATIPQEKYTFYTIPLNVGIIYRLEYFKRQWIAPYVSGGLSYIGLAELRDDNRNFFAGTPGGYGGGGVMFNISAVDRSVAFDLSNEYGVANLWLIAEYRYQQSFSDELNFSGGIMTFGIGADF
jgi:hypothetical protein